MSVYDACDGMMRFKGSYCNVIANVINSNVNGIMHALLCEPVCTCFSSIIIKSVTLKLWQYPTAIHLFISN